MRLTKEELIALHQPQRARASGRTDCPTEEELVLATTDEMPEADRRLVAAHLTACLDCAEEFSLIRPLKSFAEQAAAETAPGAITIANAWGPGVARLSWWRRFTMDLYYGPASFAIAVLLLLVSVALGVWVTSIRRENRLSIARLEQEVSERDQAARSATESLEETKRQLEEDRRRYESQQSSGPHDTEIADLRRTVEELSRPQLNAPIIQLEPQSSVRSQRSPETVIEVPSGANLFTLVLNVAGEQSHSSYALEIVDQSGKVVWQGRGLRKSPYNTFTVALARRLLAAGQYHIKLFGSGGNRRELVEDFAVRVEYK